MKKLCNVKNKNTNLKQKEIKPKQNLKDNNIQRIYNKIKVIK